jgi:hypothetical protein
VALGAPDSGEGIGCHPAEIGGQRIQVVIQIALIKKRNGLRQPQFETQCKRAAELLEARAQELADNGKILGQAHPHDNAAKETVIRRSLR